MSKTMKQLSPKNMGQTLLRLFSYFKFYKWTFIGGILFSIIGTLGTIAFNTMLGPLVDSLVTNYNMSAFIKYLIILGSIAVVIAIGQYLGTYLTGRLAQNVVYKIHQEMFEHMEQLPMSYFDTHPQGQLMSTFTNDVEMLTRALEQSVAQILTSVISVVGTFIMMLLVSVQLTFTIIVMVFVITFVVRFISSKSAMNFRNQQAQLSEMNGYVSEMMTGQKVVKVFNHEEKTIEDFKTRNDILMESGIKATTYSVMIMPIMGGLSFVSYSLSAMLGSFFVIAGSISIGNVVQFLQYNRAFFNPITQVSNQMNMLLAAIAGAERIFTMLDEEIEVDDGTVTLVSQDGEEYWKTETGELHKVEGSVIFENVDFGYLPGQKVLNDVSLYAKPGQKIAFVGSTGAGKTTITNLINRFYEISEGKILYDGIEIKDINKKDLRSTQSIVLQDVNLFKGTIRENIRYGRLDATDEEVKEAAMLANADYFIRTLPHGYDTVLEENGSNLSQGERQLLSIARAAITNPKILILDEATSSIDTRTEKLVAQGMDKLMRGRTTFVIAHRLSTVRDADAIMVLEDGRIIERGDHDDLMAAKGRYYNLNTGTLELE